MAVDVQDLSRDDLIAALMVAVGEIDVLRAEVAELRRRLGQDSTNSSRPSSSNSPFTKPAPKSSAMRGTSGRKPGKQPGAAGTTRRQVADPEVIVVSPAACTDCGTDLTDTPVSSMRRHQVIEVTPPPPKVTEYQVCSKICPNCGTKAAMVAPALAAHRVQFGPRIKARAVLTTMAHHIPFGRAKTLLEHLAGIEVSTGWLVKNRRLAADGLEVFMTHIRHILHSARLLHVDETPVRANGKLAYLHVACDEHFTAMHTGGRTIADIDAGQVLDGFAGILIRDGYSGYQHLIDAVHVWCGAHTLRDLKAIHDRDPQNQRGAEAMANTLTLALSATHRARAAGRATLTGEQITQINRYYTGAIAAMRTDNTPPTTDLNKRSLTLANRFAQHRDMILAFIGDLSIPFTNNQAERDVRGAKIRQRVSGSWRTLTGLADYAIIWSYLSTAAKHGRDHLDVLTELFTGKPWLPPDPATTAT